MISNHKKTVLQNDYKAGKQAETELLNVLNDHNIVSTTTKKFCWHDFRINGVIGGHKFLVEHKRRFNNKNKYDTTIVPHSKIVEWRKVKQNYDGFLLIFTFNDGRYYIDYKTLMELKKTESRIKVDWFQRYSGYKHSMRKHLFMPVSILKPFNEHTLKQLCSNVK